MQTNLVTDVEVVDIPHKGRSFKEVRVRIYNNGHASTSLTGRFRRMNTSQLQALIDALQEVLEATND